MTPQNRALGLASALGVIFIWSGFVVISRLGVLTDLTPYDVTGLRFVVAGGLTLPFVVWWWPRHLPLGVQALVALTGPGILYSLLMYTGLEAASAAYGGVFANGSLPLFTTLIVLVLAGTRPGRAELLAIAVIFAGGVLVGYRGMVRGGADVAFGIALFLAASFVLSVYIFAIRRWSITPKQALALVNIPNMVLFLPVWILLPSGLTDASLSQILLQALYQGLGPGFLAVILFAISAVHLGPTLTAGFSAAVPALASVMAIPVLGEMPGPFEWVGIGIVSVGILLMVRAR